MKIPLLLSSFFFSLLFSFSFLFFPLILESGYLNVNEVFSLYLSLFRRQK